MRPALTLVGYEEELRPAMAYVFGSTLVCDTLENAKKVREDLNLVFIYVWVSTFYKTICCTKISKNNSQLLAMYTTLFTKMSRKLNKGINTHSYIPQNFIVKI